MSVEVKRVQSRKELRQFASFPLKLYKGSKTYVPGLLFDEINTLDAKKNAACEFCDLALFLAYKDGAIAGRVAAIVNHRANKTWNHEEVRFGWFDFIDDKEVSAALLAQVEAFGREKGMTTITGPLGFTDFDPEGMLIEGFDCMATLGSRSNHPYYRNHVEALGFSKEVDWLEYKVFIPDEMPDKYIRVSKLVEEKYGLHTRKLTRRDVSRTDIGQRLFALINESYAKLYNFTNLPPKVVEGYISFYLGVINLDFISIVEDESGELLGFGITMPSITRAIQKCKGRLFPFGWYYILRSMYLKYEENVELLLIGVKPEFQKKGVNSLIFSDLIPKYIKAGFKYAETNSELEYNYSVQAQWMDLEYDQCKRRRVFTKPI